MPGTQAEAKQASCNMFFYNPRVPIFSQLVKKQGVDSSNNFFGKTFYFLDQEYCPLILNGKPYTIILKKRSALKLDTSHESDMVQVKEPIFTYTIHDQSGNKVKDNIRAFELDAVVQKLHNPNIPAPTKLPRRASFS